jgi:hypothetical protein
MNGPAGRVSADRLRPAAFVALALLGVAAAGCTVGSGSGSAKGTLWVNGCNNSSNYGTPPGRMNMAAVPAAYDLQPTFFAGEPIDDLSMANPPKNRLVLRMQSSGLALQYNDTLYFDIEDSYEVARCVRGHTVGGQPDWKVGEPLYDTPPGGPLPLWCDWSATAAGDGGGAGDGGLNAGADAAAPSDGGATADGGMSVMAAYPRIYITPDTDLRSSLALLSTCPTANVSADAINTPSGASWIEFMNFGSAEQPDLPSDLRTPITAGFIINYGERLRANFHLVLQDTAVVSATENLMPIPTPLLGATLDGYFDFDLERGRAAQLFP